MARKPSTRHHRASTESSAELTLTPLLNVVLMLIPALLTTTSFVDVSVVGVSAPRIGGASGANGGGTADTANVEPLNLTVIITDEGFTIAAARGVLSRNPADPTASSGPTIPRKADGVLDFAALTRRLREVKEAVPEETKVIITAEPQIEYELVIKTMDAARETPDHKELFPNVVLSAGVT